MPTPTFSQANTDLKGTWVVQVLISSFSLVWEKFTRIKCLGSTRYCATDHEETEKESQSSNLFTEKGMRSQKLKLKINNSKNYKKDTNFNGNTEEEEINVGSC